MIQKKTIVKFLIAFVMPLAFFACSSDSEPDSSVSGKKEYELILATICDEDGEIAFGHLDNDPSQKIAYADDEKWATIFCATLLDNPEWNRKKATRSISDGFGSLTVTPSEEEGVFYTVIFNLKGIDPFTLTIVTKEYYENENIAFPKPPELYHGVGAGSYVYCKKCWRATPNVTTTTAEGTVVICQYCGAVAKKIEK